MSRLRHRRFRRSASYFAGVLLVASAALSSNTASAANVSWTDAANKWESTNWTGGLGTNPPTAADTAIIGNGGVVGYDATTGTRTVLALQVGNPNIGNGTLNISGGSLTVTNNVTISGQGNTSGTINITGTGSLNVGGIVQDGGNGPSTVTLNGGTLDLASDGSPGSIAVNTFNAQSGTLRNVSQIFQGDNTTVTALTKTTPGTLTLSGTNTYTGGTNINGGTLALGSSAALGTTGTISFAGGTLQYSASNTTDYSNRFSNAAAQAYSIDTNGQNVTFATGLTSSGGTFTKLGTGTLTFTAGNTYSGATTISAGTLKLDNNNTTTARLASTSGIAVNSGGTLLLAQTGVASTDRINNAAGVTISGGGTFATGGLSEGARPTNSGATNGAAGMGALTLQSTSSVSRAMIDFLTGANGSTLAFSSLVGGNGAFLDIKNWTGTPFTDDSSTGNDRLLFGIDPGLTAAQLANVRFFDDSGAFIGAGEIIGYGNMFELVAVPEPSTWLAAALALGAIGFSQRKRLRTCVSSAVQKHS
jgi:fibronectin-binding autotransporter adhesin